MDLGLRGKGVVVTGASKGIGRDDQIPAVWPDDLEEGGWRRSRGRAE